MTAIRFDVVGDSLHCVAGRTIVEKLQRGTFYRLNVVGAGAAKLDVVKETNVRSPIGRTLDTGTNRKRRHKLNCSFVAFRGLAHSATRSTAYQNLSVGLAGVAGAALARHSDGCSEKGAKRSAS